MLRAEKVQLLYVSRRWNEIDKKDDDYLTYAYEPSQNWKHFGRYGFIQHRFHAPYFLAQFGQIYYIEIKFNAEGRQSHFSRIKNTDYR